MPEPLQLADGRVVFPGGRVRRNGEAETEHVVRDETPDDTRLITSKKRKLSELLESPRVMNAISVIMAYSLFGLDDTDICTLTNLDEVQIAKLRKSDAYVNMYDAVVNSVMDAEAKHVRGLFQKHARTAAGVLIDTLHNGTRPERFTVARDLLDRAGHRPSDVVEHHHRMDGGLTIEIVRKDSEKSAPTIDMEVE